MDNASIRLKRPVPPTGYPSALARFYSVQMPIVALNTVYQFNLLKIPLTGKIGVLVPADSDILPYLKPGTAMKMKYYPVELLEASRYLMTRIVSIRRFREGKTTGFCLVELAVGEDAH